MGLTEDILSADQSQSLKVNVPEWSRDVYVRVLTLGELQTWELSCLRAKGEGVDDFRTRYLAMALVDADGKPLFTSDQLKRLSGRVGARLFKIAQKHNDLDDTEIQDIGKN
jgi:hypothetical protein